MGVYIKGGVVAVLVSVALLLWYRSVEPRLPTNQSPPEYAALDKMEAEGVPDFEVERLDGSKLKLSDLRGKMVIVNFWASWCNPCVEEFPSMVKLAERMKGDVVVVAVSTDEVKKDIEPFLKAFGLPKPHFEVVWDKDHSVMKKYGVNKIPESYIVGANGKLARKVAGIEDWGSDDAVMFFKFLMNGAKPLGGEPAKANKAQCVRKSRRRWNLAPNERQFH